MPPMRLAYLGISPDRLTLNHNTSRFTLAATRGGYVTQANLHDGQYVEPTTELMELIDDEHFHIELKI